MPALQSHRRRPTGPPTILGWEIARPVAGWPPRIPNVTWRDLGVIDTGPEQWRIIKTLQSDAGVPGALVVVCSLATTPDRGIGSFLTELRSMANSNLALVLTGGQTIRQRGGMEQLAGRLRDWRALTEIVGIDPSRVLELDLDHLTDASAANLAALVSNPDESAQSPGRRIEPAFALIVEHVRRWQRSGPPDLEAQANLHREIAAVYREGQAGWRGLLRLPTSNSGDILEHVKSGSMRVLDLLPTRLRKSPRWLAAGAAAGALGCIGAATLISPVAIASLPMWSAIGAAIGAIVQPTSDKATPARASSTAPDCGDAVRSAALFAVLLELQGRDESTITRILDRLIPDDNMISPALTTERDVQSWLDELRHRLDMNLADEVSS